MNENRDWKRQAEMMRAEASCLEILSPYDLHEQRTIITSLVIRLTVAGKDSASKAAVNDLIDMLQKKESAKP